MKEEAPPANDRTYEPKETTTASKAKEIKGSGTAGEEENESAGAATVPHGRQEGEGRRGNDDWRGFED